MRKGDPDSMKRYKIYLFALLSMLFWAFSFVWVKIVYAHEYRPIMTIFIRLVISSLILYIVIKLLKRGQKIEKADYGKFLLLALFQPFLYFLGESYALKEENFSSTVAAVIISTIPLITPFFSYIFVREKVTLLNVIGLVISFCGILLMVVDPDFSLSASPIGILLEFCAVFSAIFYSVVVKKLTFKYSSFTIIKAQNILGAIYFLPLFLIVDLNQFLTVRPDTELIYAILMLAVFASSGAYLFFIPVVRELGINKSNMFTNFIPVFTAVTSFFVLYEVFNLNKIIGMTVVIAGVVVSQLQLKPKENLKNNI
jgi:drug/metabolite transporter (DMT)-like permease